MKICQNCGHQNLDDTNFCVNCGSNLENAISSENMKICQSCGHQNLKDTNFCVNCGSNLENATPIEDMAECPKCGHQNLAESTFCVNCGSDLKDTAPTEKEEMPTEAEVKEEETTEEPIGETPAETQTEEETTEEPVEETTEETEDVKICQSCGQKNLSESMFCVNCGGNLQNPEPTQQENINQETPQAQFIPNEKFDKKEKKVVKKMDNLMCPIGDLFVLSMTENEYRKTANYFDEWVTTYALKKVEKLWYFGLVEHWENFKLNCINGSLAFMVLGDYEGCLRNCDRLLEIEETVYKKGIGSRTGYGLVASVKTFAALTGKTGTEEQQELYQKIRFFKAVSLLELGRKRDAHDMLVNLPANYNLQFTDHSPYFNEHFKYKNNFTVSEFLKLIDEE